MIRVECGKEVRERIILELYLGSKPTGISVQPDQKYPKMYRVHRGAKVSDMVNLTRAKDAAIRWATPAEGGIGHRLSWKVVGSVQQARAKRSDEPPAV